MHKIMGPLILLILFGAGARAESCPDFFRFVDFGLDTPDGTTRGGPTYRAESFEGQGLLIRDRTTCRTVPNLASDGHGNPIPVVTSVEYDPDKTGIDLSELRLTSVDDVVSETEQSAAAHRARLEHQNVTIERGSEYLCASLQDRKSISCQFISPVGGNLALVVHCDPSACTLPMLALNEKVVAVAKWRPSQASVVDHQTAISEMAGKVQKIHDFLDPLSSWRPDFTRVDR